ncbi:Aspartic peptidase [Trema orientale]|uniref:Aspartic peptidase n=1 Tax=Trema orientale TaxID=63057 RepID=A0A2P5D863_TREOI|nr:Aspartic peptidase [Trema orientale]
MAPSKTNGIALTKLIMMIFMLTLTITMLNIGIHGFSIKLTPITSLFQTNLSLEEKHYNLFEISRTRAELNTKQHSMILSNTIPAFRGSTNYFTSKPNAITLRPPVRRRAPSGYYMTQLSIGSKLFSPYLVMDTSTDLTWVQCEGCTNCFPVSGTGNFKYQESSSYHKLPCNHTLCVPKLCTSDKLYCRYHNRYRASTSTGLLSTETFTFATNTNETTAKYTSILFGCGLDNRNLPFSAPNNVIAGIFGLAPTARSLLIQLENKTKRRFSYCLTTSDWPTMLHFGDDATISHRGLQTTPLVGLPKYYVSMFGISIDKTRLNISASAFQLKSNLKGGFVFDSGSPYSFLVDNAYKILKTEMIKYIARRYPSLRPIPRGMGKFDLCYNLTTTPLPPGGYAFPPLTYHLKGADFFMTPDVVFEDFGAVRCLAMLIIDDDGPTILGAFQQTNYRFLFDASLSKQSLSFAPETCV